MGVGGVGGGNNGSGGGGVVATKYHNEKKEGACGRGLVRSYLYVFNVFLLLASIILGGLGVWSVLAEVWFIPLLSDLSYPLPSYLLLGAGVVGLIGATVGCCGIAKSDKCFLLIYILLLLVVFLLQVMAGTLAYFYRESAFHDLQGRLNSTFATNYGVEGGEQASYTTVAVDELQRHFQCCGSGSFVDWQGSQWQLSGASNGNKVPDSCCKTEMPGCGVRDHPSNIYYTGCIHRLADTVKTHLGYLTIAGLGLCLLQIFGVVFATCLYVKLKEPDAVHL